VQLSPAALKATDILILPELGDFSAGGFNRLPKTVPIGEAAARKVADLLSRLSLPPTEYAHYARASSSPRPRAPCRSTKSDSST
jgi:NTE family protein